MTPPDDMNHTSPWWTQHGPHLPVRLLRHDGLVICEECLVILRPDEYVEATVKPSEETFRSKIAGHGREFVSLHPTPILNHD